MPPRTLAELIERLYDHNDKDLSINFEAYEYYPLDWSDPMGFVVTLRGRHIELGDFFDTKQVKVTDVIVDFGELESKVIVKITLQPK